MELKLKLLKWFAGVPVAMLNLKTAERLGVHANERILIRNTSRSMKSISLIVDTIEDGIVKEDEIAVSSELKERFNLHLGRKVDIELAPPPNSIFLIKKKLNKKRLSEIEINEIIDDIMKDFLSEAEIALFVSAMYENGMNLQETIFLIKAIMKSGKTFKLKNKIIADKHSIGGIPGNRTTPIVVPICAAGGLIFPKNSSRAITSAAGTADVIETIAKVNFSIEKLKKIIKKTNACMVWGGSLGLVPADSRIIKVEKSLKIDPESQLLASIMSKKLAVGSTHILIDIPYDSTAKVDLKGALRLKRKFENLGRYFKKKIKVVLTDGSQPIGNGIGPALELSDVISVLDQSENRPKDLEKKSLFLAGKLFEITGKAKKGNGITFAEKILYSGKAFEKFKEIILAQEGSLENIGKIREAKFKTDILSKHSGKVLQIDNKKISELARVTGCPADKFAGLFLHAPLGKKIKKNDRILTIYSESKSRMKEAVVSYHKNPPLIIR